MIREIIGATTLTGMLSGRNKKRNGMSNTMLGVVGTAIGVGAYMVYKNMNKQ